MTFLAPGWLAVAAIASLAVAALHLIAWRTPRPVGLPTARFVPDDPARRAARTVRLSDLALLALRIAILMAVGMALARPITDPSPRGAAVVVAIDAGGADTSAIRASLQGMAGDTRATFVVFDTSARIVADADAALQAAARQAPGMSSLSVGLVAATREALRLKADFEPVRVMLVAPFSRAAFDDATALVRSLWRDSMTVVRVPPLAMAGAAGGVIVPGDLDDPVVAGARLAAANGLLGGDAVLVRDSAVAQGAATVVLWPRAASGDSVRVDGVHAGNTTAIGHFVRSPDGSTGGVVVARWIDGSPAAREVPQGPGCVRRVNFDVADQGDFALTPTFQRLVAELLGPCRGGAPRYEPAPDSLLAALAAVPGGDAPADAVRSPASPNRLAAILMAVAIALAFVELLLRGRPRRVSPLTEQAA